MIGPATKDAIPTGGEDCRSYGLGDGRCHVLAKECISMGQRYGQLQDLNMLPFTATATLASAR